MAGKKKIVKEDSVEETPKSNVSKVIVVIMSQNHADHKTEREFTLEVHGANFQKLADMFIETNKNQVLDVRHE